MAILNVVLDTDVFDAWRDKTNAAINLLNNGGIAQIVKIIDPLNDQDILIYNTSSGFFENTGISALVTQIMAQLAAIPVSNLKPYYLATTFRSF